LFFSTRSGKVVTVQAIPVYGGAEAQSHTFIISALDGCEWLD